jgi:hypothetical protein
MMYVYVYVQCNRNTDRSKATAKSYKMLCKKPVEPVTYVLSQLAIGPFVSHRSKAALSPYCQFTAVHGMSVLDVSGFPAMVGRS